LYSDWNLKIVNAAELKPASELSENIFSGEKSIAVKVENLAPLDLLLLRPQMIEAKKVVTIYAESTPNPAAMKFVANSMLLLEGSVEYLSVEDAKNSPLATQLFSFGGVASVFIAANFITVNKKQKYDWFDLIPILREFIKSYLDSGEKVFIGPSGQKADDKIEQTTTTNKVESKIIEMLDEYVRPAVEGDGGAIHFKSFDDGKLTLILKGACSGCPSSMVTLKAGIERLLKQFIPEVKEVVAEEQ
jgi:Fe-S cluster biogenesis protein NfuA